MPGGLPPAPTEQHPFVFFHLRKAGGSQLKYNLVQAGARLNVSTFFPCYGKIPCETYAPYPVRRRRNPGTDEGDAVRSVRYKYAIFGGHFPWPSVQSWAYASAGMVPRMHSKRLPFTCLVQLRPTLDRVRSCWNYRFVKEDGRHLPQEVAAYASSRGGFLRFPKAGEVSAHNLSTLLPRMRDQYGSGCNNEILRIFSSIGADEERVNGIREDDPAAAALLNETRRRLSQCVITRVDRCAESREVIAHHLPWLLADYDTCGDGSHNSIRSHHNSIRWSARSNFTAEAAAVVLKLNGLDERIFRVGARLFEHQLRRARGAAGDRNLNLNLNAWTRR